MGKNTNKEDIVLIQKTVDGNREAENCLYEKYKQVVCNYIINKYSNYSDIDDDVSEIMVRVFTNLCSYNEDKSKFKTWVISITKNYLIDKWRQYQNCITLTAGNTVTLDGSIDVSSFVTSDNTGEIEIGLNGTSVNGFAVSSTSCEFENCSSLNYLSQQVTTTDFQLLDMKYSMGYSYNEIGCEFNLTSNTVSNRVNYVKSKLKKNNKEEIFQ